MEIKCHFLTASIFWEVIHTLFTNLERVFGIWIFTVFWPAKCKLIFPVLLVGFLFLVAIHHTICQIKITNCFTMINNNNIKTVKTLIRYSLQILGKCNTSNQENNINIYWLICLWCNYSGFVNYFVFCIVFVMTATHGSQLRSESWRESNQPFLQLVFPVNMMKN